jgi:hypothetical protein
MAGLSKGYITSSRRRYLAETFVSSMFPRHRKVLGNGERWGQITHGTLAAFVGQAFCQFFIQKLQKSFQNNVSLSATV